jgi:hypothetical protein
MKLVLINRGSMRANFTPLPILLLGVVAVVAAILVDVDVEISMDVETSSMPLGL